MVRVKLVHSLECDMQLDRSKVFEAHSLLCGFMMHTKPSFSLKLQEEVKGVINVTTYTILCDDSTVYTGVRCYRVICYDYTGIMNMCSRPCNYTTVLVRIQKQL